MSADTTQQSFPCPDHVHVGANVWRTIWEATDYNVNLNGIPGAYPILEAANKDIPDIRHVQTGTTIYLPPELCRMAGELNTNPNNGGSNGSTPLGTPTAYDMAQTTPQALIPSHTEIKTPPSTGNWLLPTGILSGAIVASLLVMMIRRSTMRRNP